MELYFLIFTILIFTTNCLEEDINYIKRLTYREEFDPNNSFYILNTEEPYKFVKNLVKNEIITNSSSYTYEWSDHESKTYISFKDYLPPEDSEGYRDMTNYDFIYINVYSKNNVGSKIILVLYCQKREPDEISQMTNSYKSFPLTINFIGWKEIKIPYLNLDDSYGADLTKVSGLTLYATGWGCVPNKDSILIIDKILFTKTKYIFNMKESEIFEENYSNILKRFKYSLIGSSSLITEKNENIVKRLKSIVKTAEKTHDLINKSGLPFSYSMENSQDMNEIYYKIRQMAMGYAVEGGDLNKNKEFYKDIIDALDYMHDNYYTKKSENIFNGLDNWWNWQIGVPQALVEIIIYLKDELTDEEINKYLTPLNEYIPLPSMTMANRADIAYSCIIAGALQRNYSRIAFSVEMLRELFNIVEQGDGFYEDGSFIQHTVYAYIGGYGSALINSLSKIAYSLEETCFRFDDDMKEKQYNWISNSYIPFLFEGAFFDLVRGRNVVRNPTGLSTGVNAISSFCFIAEYINDKNNIAFLKSYLKSIYQKEQTFYDSSLLISSLGILEEIILDENIKVNEGNNNFAKVFSRMDKAIAQVNGVGLGISLSSSRTGKYESINGENKKGWYQGDGMTYIYLSPQDYANSYWPYVNYYRLPGTTVTKSPREEKATEGNKVLAKYDFVGGAYFDINMVVAMEFASENNYTNFYSSLIGNKAYFIFGNIFVFMGNNISCNDNYDVETIIENRKLNGKLYFGDKEITGKSGSVDSNYIYIENYGGIYIPDYSNVKYDIAENNFLEIYIEHGKNIKNSSYKYYIIPNIEKNELLKYISKIEIISETNKISAVKNIETNIIEYIFWEKGNIDNLKVDNPCTILIKGNDLYISDPTQKIEYINVSFGTDNYMIRLSKGYTTKKKIKN